MKYSRENPSSEYIKHLEYYRSMHAAGYNREINGAKIFTPPEESFPGNELPKFVNPIKQVIDITDSKTILDYGAGKGKQYESEINVDKKIYKNIQEYWGVDEIIMYEPALPGKDSLPSSKVDGVISTDVLEHIPLNDIAWVVDEMFSLSKKFVFANIACYSAFARLPEGENAHCTIKPPQWWAGLFYFLEHKYPDHKYLLGMVAPATDPMGNVANQLVWASNLNVT